jgi:hypothetical protein
MFVEQHNCDMDVAQIMGIGYELDLERRSKTHGDINARDGHKRLKNISEGRRASPTEDAGHADVSEQSVQPGEEVEAQSFDHDSLLSQENYGDNKVDISFSSRAEF